MKKSLSVLTGFSLSIMICFISCQKNNDSSTPLSAQIVGKWTMTEAIGNYTSYGVNYKDTTRFTTADYYDFHADSTLTIVANGVTYDGKWQISNNKLFISETNYMDYYRGLDIPVLTSADLQLYYTETNPDHYLEQKLNLRR